MTVDSLAFRHKAQGWRSADSNGIAKAPRPLPAGGINPHKTQKIEAGKAETFPAPPRTLYQAKRKPRPLTHRVALASAAVTLSLYLLPKLVRT